MYAFDYKNPSSLSEATDMLRSSDDGQLIAGGHTLLPPLKQRLASASDLIDLAGVKRAERNFGTRWIGDNRCNDDAR